MRNDDSEKLGVFTRRALLLGAAKLSMVSVLLGRLFYMQVLKTDEYMHLSEVNRVRQAIIPPLRGLITDRFGAVLATNNQNYKLVLEKEYNKEHYQKIVDLVAKLLKLSENDKQIMLTKITKTVEGNDVILYENLSWDEVAAIEFDIFELDGVYIDTGYSRFYPKGPLFANIIGYVGPISEAEIKTLKIEAHPEIKIGKAGLEKTQNPLLEGKPGIKRLEVNAKGTILREISVEQSTNGQVLKLALDNRLQEYAYKIAGEEGVAITMLDIITGEVLVMASTPSYDPNQFTHGISSFNWANIVNNPELPMTNKNISLTYPPGSAFKLAVCLAALEAGIDESHSVFCDGNNIYGGHNFHCWSWKFGGHGRVNMVQALMQSCNTYMFNIAQIIGMDKIAATARKLGLGERLLPELPREVVGVVPDKEWLFKKLGRPWHLGDTLNCSIGQGYVLSTPLQLTIMMARIASGTAITPKLIIPKETNKLQIKFFDDIGIKEEHLDVIRKTMHLVVNSPQGTAYNYRSQDDMFEIAGKTSTVQVVSKKGSTEDYNKYHDKKLRNHGVFSCYAPFDNPRFACCVLVENGGGAGAAAPLARDLLLEAKSLYL